MKEIFTYLGYAVGLILLIGAIILIGIFLLVIHFFEYVIKKKIIKEVR
jgi:hypothetical protein